MDILDNTYFETHAADMLREKHLTKAAFAERMGVRAQNVTKVFETKNVNTLMRVAQVLGVSLAYLIDGGKTNDDTNDVDGFIEVNGVIHRIKCKEDIEKVLELL